MDKPKEALERISERVEAYTKANEERAQSNRMPLAIQQLDDLHTALAYIAQLEAALKPFVDIARWQTDHLDQMGINMPDSETVSVCIPIGEFRAARATLGGERTSKPHGEKTNGR